jgi:drug/metabolite transporter (DMT)-like permease
VNKALFAHFQLIAVSIIWSFTFFLTKTALFYLSPASVVLSRFLIALLCSLCFVSKTYYSWHYIKELAILGILNAIVYFSMTYSLNYITTAHCALLVGANVIFVPFVAYFLIRQPIELYDIFSSVLFLIGFYIFNGMKILSFNPGDILMFFCEIAYSFYLVYWQMFSFKTTPVLDQTFYQILLTLPLPLIWVFIETNPHWDDAWRIINNCPLQVWLAIAFCGIFANFIAHTIQASSQRYLDAHRVALILALEPIFAALFAYFYLQEPIALHMWAGGSVMLIAALLPILKQKSTA